MRKEKNILKYILGIISVLLIILVSVSVSYGAWIFTKSQTGVNELKVDCFKMTLTDENNILLNNTFPLTESDAMNLTPYTYTVTNICSHAGNYQINFETLDTTTLSLDYLNIKVDNEATMTLGSIVNNSYTVLENALSSKMIQSGVLGAGQSVTHHFRLWLDENATQSQVENKKFSGKLTVKTVLNYESYVLTTFNTNGGDELPLELQTKSILYGQPYGELPLPTKEGYTFDGWYSDPTSGEEITLYSTVQTFESQTVYAHWSEITDNIDPGE